LKVCSADTILRTIKELSTPQQEYISSSGVTHYFNALSSKKLAHFR